MISAAYTDVGIIKKVNQDSLVIKEAKINGKEIAFAAVCDGMGGLRDGEIASGEAVAALSAWFSSDLPELMKGSTTSMDIRKSLNSVIIALDEKIERYSYMYGDCGTTLSGILLYNGMYMTVNVGDSRVYRINEDGKACRLTHDQTVVQQKLDAGEITEEQALCHPGQNVLLQCIGAGNDVVPVYTEGSYEDKSVFIICSDGFRHKLREDEFSTYFMPNSMRNERGMLKAAKKAVEENKKRRERDNITVIIIKTS